LHFLVLDEVHTYHGARGIEVACLIRRLKEHVNKLDGKLVCVGTSATIKGNETGPVARFATELFGETFRPEHVRTERSFLAACSPAMRCFALWRKSSPSRAP
jgi:DEAD/DEAH box helicase domain-containing protein